MPAFLPENAWRPIIRQEEPLSIVGTFLQKPSYIHTLPSMWKSNKTLQVIQNHTCSWCQTHGVQDEECPLSVQWPWILPSQLGEPTGQPHSYPCTPVCIKPTMTSARWRLRESLQDLTQFWMFWFSNKIMDYIKTGLHRAGRNEFLAQLRQLPQHCW